MFAQKLTELRKEKKLTQVEMAEKLGVARTTYSSYEQGRRMPDSDIQKKMANYFNVSLDYLHGRTDVKKPPYYSLSNKEKKDIAVQAEELMEGLQSDGDLNFYGEPASEAQKERLLVAIRTAMEMNKEEAKKKFTTKKYRD